jgi:hypothetical protein
MQICESLGEITIWILNFKFCIMTRLFCLLKLKAKKWKRNERI